MIEYKVKDFTEEDSHYSLSYQELRELYYKFIHMSNKEFASKLPEAAHFACVVSWFKELGNEATIGDCGIVHEIIHLMVNGRENKWHFNKVRRQFKTILKLD